MGNCYTLLESGLVPGIQVHDFGPETEDRHAVLLGSQTGVRKRGSGKIPLFHEDCPEVIDSRIFLAYPHSGISEGYQGYMLSATPPDESVSDWYIVHVTSVNKQMPGERRIPFMRLDRKEPLDFVGDVAETVLTRDEKETVQHSALLLISPGQACLVGHTAVRSNPNLDHPVLLRPMDIGLDMEVMSFKDYDNHLKRHTSMKPAEYREGGILV